MASGDVPPHEMHWFRPHSDPIDSVLDHSPTDGDLADVAAIVHDLRAAYLPDREIERSPELLALTGASLHDKGDRSATAGRNADGSVSVTQAAGLPNADDQPSKEKTMLTALAAFVATTTGKVLVGTTVAAAAVGGAHAADVIDVPLLPDRPSVESVESLEVDEADLATDDEVAEDGDDSGDTVSDEAPTFEAPTFGKRVAGKAREGGVDGEAVAEDAPEFGTGVATEATEGTPAEGRVGDVPGPSSTEVPAEAEDRVPEERDEAPGDVPPVEPAQLDPTDGGAERPGPAGGAGR